MTQQELEALLARMGSLGVGDFREETKQEDIPNPAATANGGLDPNAPLTIKGPVIYRTWVKPGTNQRLTVKVNEGGTYTKVFDGADDAIKPAAASTGGTNTSIGVNPVSGKPTQITTYPDGRPPTYDDTQVPAAAAGEAKPPTTEDRGGRRYVWKPNPGGPNAGGKWEDIGDAPETPAERQAREAAAPTQSVTIKEVGGKSYTIITIVPKPGQPGSPGQVVLGPDNKIVPGGLPGEPPKSTLVDRPVNGVHYTQVNTQNPDGSVGVSFLGPDSKPIARLPSEGEASIGGPEMPEIILGNIEWAMPEYHRRLYADPTLTPAQRKERFEQFVQVSLAVQNQANTLQRERESQRNADYNTASTKLNYLGSSTDAALKFVMDLKGADTAGQAFVALMGINMLNMATSGIGSIASAGTSVPKAGQLNLNDPKALAAQQQQINSQLSATAAERAAPTATPEAGQPGKPITTGQPAAPAPASAGPAANPNGVTTPGAPPAPITAEQAAAYERGGVNPATGDISVQATPSAAPPTADPALTGANPMPSDMPPGYMPPTPPDPNDPINQHPDGRVLPQPIPPAPLNADPTAMDPTYQQPQYPPPNYGVYPNEPEGGNTNIQQAQPNKAMEYPALAALAPRPMHPSSPAPDMRQSPALLHVQAASKPVWEMSQSEYEQYKAAGVPDEVIFSVPGRQRSVA